VGGSMTNTLVDVIHSEPIRSASQDADNLAAAGLPFGHPRAKCWERRVGNKWNLHICTYEVPGGLRSHREQIVQELVAVYRPGCAPEQFDQVWEDEWIGSYRAPTAGPLTTTRDPSGTEQTT